MTGMVYFHQLLSVEGMEEADTEESIRESLSVKSFQVM